MTLDDAPAVMTIAEVAEVARVSRQIVARAVHRRELPALITGSTIRVHRDAVRAWLLGEKNETATRESAGRRHGVPRDAGIVELRP